MVRGSRMEARAFEVPREATEFRVDAVLAEEVHTQPDAEPEVVAVRG